MEQRPRTVLRIALVEVGKEGSVRQVLEARGIVGHAVGRSGEVERLQQVAVLALVFTSQLAQVCGHPVAGDGSA